jgi:Family of unknown function (DUF5985)
MGAVTYALCAITALVCVVLLLRAYNTSGYSLLLWSGLCFAGLTANNVLLVLDKVVFPAGPDLSIARSSVALASVSVLLFGLIWDAE